MACISPACAWHLLTCDFSANERFYLAWLGVPSERFLGEDQVTIYFDLEYPAVRGDHFQGCDLRLKLFD